jgi:hypothetical protein
MLDDDDYYENNYVFLRHFHYNDIYVNNDQLLEDDINIRHAGNIKYK